MINRCLVLLARWTVHHRVLVVFGLLLLTGAAVALLPKFQFEPDLSRLLPEDDPLVQLAREIEDRTRNTRVLLIDLHGPNLAEKLPAIVANLEESPYLEAVDATREQFARDVADRYRKSPLYYLPDSVLDALEERLGDEARRPALVNSRERLAADPLAGREVVIKDPLGLRWIIEEGVQSQLPVRLAQGTEYVVLESGDRAVLSVRGTEVPYDLDFTRGLLADVRTKLDVPGVECGLYGDYAQADVDSQRVRRDLGSSATISMLFVALFLSLSMRRLLDPVIVFFPVALALFWALPFGGALLGPMTALTISAVAILIGLGVDFTIHYLVRYAAERQNAEHGDAVSATMTGIGKPLLASMLTTVAAFLSLSLGDFPGLKTFGLLLALGLGLAFFSALFVLPVILGFRPRIRRVSPHSYVVSALEKCVESRAGRPLAGFLLLISAIGIVAASIRGVDFATDLDFFRPQNDQFVANEGLFEEELGFAIMPVALLFDDDTPAEEIARAVERLRHDSVVGLASGWIAGVPSPARCARVERFHAATRGWVNATLEDLAAVGFRPDVFRPALEDFEEHFRTVPEPPEPDRVQYAGESHQLVMVHPRLNITSRDAWLSFSEEVNYAFGASVFGFHPQALLEEVQKLLRGDLVLAAMVTALVAACLVAVLCGGLRAGFLALLPSICGFGITLGFLAIWNLPLNMGNCVAIPFLLGLGVDHGIHLVAHFRQTGSRRAGACGVAIWRSSATTVLAFGSLIMAETPGIASLGLLSILGVVACVLTSLIVLPVLWPLGARNGRPGYTSEEPPAPPPRAGASKETS